MINYLAFRTTICHIVVLIGEVLDYMYLAKTTTRIKFVLVTYILFLTKLQKRQTL